MSDCDPTDCSTPGLPVHHQFQELTQTYVHRVGDAIQPSYPLWSPSPPAFSLSPASGSFPVSWLFSSGSQSIEAMCKARLSGLLSVGRGIWVQIQIALTLKVKFFFCCFLGRMEIQMCNGYGFGWTLGTGDGQGGLACCSSWRHKESDTTEQLN